jgi:hypothetical protein
MVGDRALERAQDIEDIEMESEEDIEDQRVNGEDMAAELGGEDVGYETEPDLNGEE